MQIRNTRVYIKIEKDLLYYSKPMKVIASNLGGAHWLSFNLREVIYYKLKRRWFFGYSLHFSIREYGSSNFYSLPLPGLSKSELKKLIEAINLNMEQASAKHEDK